MKFVNPNIESSYRESAMGKVLYDTVIETGAQKIIDFGVLNGYSTVCLALAAKVTGGTVYAYDLFEKYEFNNSTIKQLKSNLIKYEVENIVQIKNINFYEWIKNIEHFDILHLDISNDGDIIGMIKQVAHDNCIVLFEGGSLERDRQDWMLKYNKRPINDFSDYYNVIASSSYTQGSRVFYPCISKLK